MRIETIKATNMELTPAIRKYVEEKLDYIAKLLPDHGEVVANVEVGKTTRHHQKGDVMRCEVNVLVKGDMLRVEKIEPDLYKAIDKVKDHLARMVVEWKERGVEKHRISRPGKE